MNWRRGLLLAVLHLSLAIPLVTWQEYQYWASSRGESNLVLRPVAFQEGVEWGKPDTICYWTTPQEEIVRNVNFPASIASGWHYPPHGAFTLAGISEALFGVNRRSVLATAIGFVLLIFAQWILIGAIPVIRRKRVWLDPTVLISFLAAVSTLLLVVSPRHPRSYSVPLLPVIVLWLLWFGIAFFKMLRLGWRFLRRRPA